MAYAIMPLGKEEAVSNSTQSESPGASPPGLSLG